MTQKRKHYSKQFKIDAVELVTKQGYKVSEAARNLGIHHSSLKRWKKQLETDGNQSFPGIVISVKILGLKFLSFIAGIYSSSSG